MAPRKQEMQLLVEQRDRLLREIEAIKNKVAGLEMAISLLSGEDHPSAHATEPRRQNVKATVLDLLREVGTTGLNATSAVEIARRRGILLDRGTVSSLLSRLKRDEVVAYDGERYRLPEFVRTQSFVIFPKLAGGQSSS